MYKTDIRYLLRPYISKNKTYTLRVSYTLYDFQLIKLCVKISLYLF